VLRLCAEKFRKDFEAESKADPFKDTFTIAAACQRVFKQNHLEEETIAIIPPQGYHGNDTFSHAATEWLMYRCHIEGQNILHARNGGEQHVGRLKVDGLYDDGHAKTAYQFHGCFWHGCPMYYQDRDTFNTRRQQTMKVLFDATEKHTEALRQKGYLIVEM